MIALFAASELCRGENRGGGAEIFMFAKLLGLAVIIGSAFLAAPHAGVAITAASHR